MTDRIPQIVLGAGLLVGMNAGLLAQPPAASPAGGRLEFEVASVKPAAPMTGGMFRIGMRTDQGRVSYENSSLRDVIRTGYRLKDYQIQGPEWLGDARFDIVAKIPEGHDEKDVPEMLQSLLADRFKIVVHHETKPHDTYALVVGKGGPKLTPYEEGKNDEIFLPDGTKLSGPAPLPPGGDPAARKEGEVRATTRMVFSSAGGGGGMAGGGGMGAGGMVAMGTGGNMHMQIRKQTLEKFAETLARFLGSPVADLSGIPGEYNFNLEVSREDMTRGAGIALPKAMAMAHAGGGPAGGAGESSPVGDLDTDGGGAIFKSVQEYGLKLEKRKAPIDLLVIDKIEKLPTEN